MPNALRIFRVWLFAICILASAAGWVSCDVSPVPVPTTEEQSGSGGDLNAPPPGEQESNGAQDNDIGVGAQADTNDTSDAASDCPEAPVDAQGNAASRNREQQDDTDCNQARRERQ